MFHFSFTITPMAVAMGGAVWLFSSWLSCIAWRRRRGRLMFVLEGLRFLVVTLLVFTLFRPELTKTLHQDQKPEIVILCDASGSMKTRDVSLPGNPIQSRESWLQEKLDSHFWKPLEKGAKVAVEDFSKPSISDTPHSALPIPHSEEGTDINQALENVLQRQTRLKAVLLISDGDWNLGKSPVGAATRFHSASEEGIPVFTMGVGSETFLPELILQQVSAPSYGILGEQISIPFKIQSHLPREVRTEVTLQSERGVEIKKEITIPAQSSLQDALVWSPQQMGDHILSLKLPLETDEVLTDNHEQNFHLSIRSETLKVLVVESQPRWEYRFLRNALARDPGVEMQCLLFHGHDMPVGGGRNYIPAFPSSREALSAFDVVFLGDVGIGPKELQPKDLDLLKGLVEQQGSGLVFLPGRQGKELDLVSSPLGDLMPVALDEKNRGGLSMSLESHLLLTSLGKGHLLTMLAPDEARNQEIWDHLPGFFWCADVQKSRPGSDVLAVHSTLRNSWGRMPLLVTRSYGNGKVLFMGTDSAWRWRKGVEDVYHYRFWGQVARWMAHQRHLAHGEGVRLAYSPEDPHAGEALFLQAAIFDANGFPIEKGRVSARVVSPTGTEEKLDFAPVAGGWGVFKATFTPQAGGKYAFHLESDEAGRKLDTTLLVSSPIREKVGQPANLAVLKEISDITRGSFAAPEDFDQIIKKISVLPEPKPVVKRIPLWSNPWWGGFILGLLIVYWVGRKWGGMI